jgi:uncharacterized protein (DUF1919 family)
MRERFKTLISKLKKRIDFIFLKRKDFSIISNNCWGGFVYQYYQMPYNSPFAGLFFFADDFIKLLRDLETSLNKELVFIKPENSKYKIFLLDWGTYNTYPIARLGEIEIHFLHYKDANEASEKWKRRVKRINYDNLIVKFSDRDGCTEELIQEFDSMNYKRKVCLTTRKYKYLSCYQMENCNEEIPGDEWAEFIKGTSVTKFINRFY